MAILRSSVAEKFSRFREGGKFLKKKTFCNRTLNRTLKREKKVIESLFSKKSQVKRCADEAMGERKNSVSLKEAKEKADKYVVKC